MGNRMALVLVMALLGAVPFAGPPAGATQAAQAITWRATGVQLGPGANGPLCFDAGHPNVVVVNEEEGGTVATNWATGARAPLSARRVLACGPNGWLFGHEGEDNTPWRFSVADPTGQALAHFPTHRAADGTAQVYSLAEPSPGQADGHLWASADGGLTWQERGQSLGGRVESLAVAEADARVLYALTVVNVPRRTACRIYVSSDAGVTWEQRFEIDTDRAFPEYGGPYFTLAPIPGRTAPVGEVALTINPGYPGSSNQQQVLVSGDGARTWQDAGIVAQDQSTVLIHTNKGILAMRRTGPGYGLYRSSDDGATWQKLPGPPLPQALPPAVSISFRADLVGVREAPATVFLRDGNGLWLSTDSGDTWARLEDVAGSSLAVSPYVPLTALGVRDGQLYALDLPGAAATVTAPVAATDAPGGTFFPETGHNLSGAIARYWAAHGGLAQFGYPQTEPFREVNPADGQVYLAQYFERARLEYHPAFAGTASEVLLGLLGSQITAARRAAGEAPFRPVADPHQPGVTYFAATGHTLRGPFRAYWASHGGLALYGYPLSEEFREVNPADGQTYTVQYFERNRFEAHPEHADTPYAVLLGLLGNTVLQQKGWQ
jgi:photosystem II stability/assembly factor-like uncharacterized protein